jgi:hypothetical protein
MMSKPTTAQLVTAIRENLSAAILPAVSDAGQQKLLAMIDHLMQTIAVRAEHEIDWMVTHNRAVVALAQDMVQAAAAPAPVIAALTRYRENHSTSLAASAVTADHALAAEVLATMLEATISDTGEFGLAARELLEHDVAHGVQIVGEFELVPP